MEIKIKLHSFVDVITNSSTVIFVTVGNSAINTMYEVIDEVLRVAGSDKNAKDLFDIEISRDWESILDNYIDSYDEEYSKDDREKALMEGRDAIDGWKEKSAYEMENIVPYLKETGKWKEYNTNYDDWEYSSWVSVKAKNDTDPEAAKNIGTMLRNMFDADGYRDG
jgi:hypothetical protein